MNLGLQGAGFSLAHQQCYMLTYVFCKLDIKLEASGLPAAEDLDLPFGDTSFHKCLCPAFAQAVTRELLWVKLRASE